MTLRLSFTTQNRGLPPDEKDSALKVGWLRKRGGGQFSTAFRKRWFVLTSSGYLYYFKGEKEKYAKGIIQLNDLPYVVEEAPDPKEDERNLFVIMPRDKHTSAEIDLAHPPESPPNSGFKEPMDGRKKKKERTWFICADSQEEMKAWVRVLRNYLEGYKQNRQTVKIEDRLIQFAYEIPEKDLSWNDSDVIGKGGSGTVVKGMWLGSTPVAIKVLNSLPEFIDDNELTAFYKEIETLGHLRHTNIVSMFGYCNKKTYLCLVTEYVRGGNMQEAIDRKNMGLDLVIDLCGAICSGMIFLHSKDVIHRDLKPANILIENLDEARIKICDFGLAMLGGHSKNGETYGEFGTPAYAAPELPTPHHSFKVDVWSFAMILWEMLHKVRVWSGSGGFGAKIQEKVLRGERPPLKDEHSLFNGLIVKCWAQDPRLRPNFNSIYKELEQMKISLNKRPEFEAYEIQIKRAFGGSDSLVWQKFEDLLSNIFNLVPEKTQELRFLIEKGGYVDLKLWNELLKWFSPLVLFDNYHSKSGSKRQQQQEQQEDVVGYSMEEIIDIIKPRWFFGFISQEVAKQILLKKGVGAYLFRFSGSVGFYTLSVCHSGGIGHWRISSEKKPNAIPQFKIEDKAYRSLYDIIDTHSKTPLWSTVISDIDQILLTIPCNRDKDLKDIVH